MSSARVEQKVVIREEVAADAVVKFGERGPCFHVSTT